MRVRFLLLAEGTSDAGLVPHLEALCVEAGADEASGDCPDLGRLPYPPGKRVEDRARTLLSLDQPLPDILFVHRDEDGMGSDHRRREIQLALHEAGWPGAAIAVIPIQELEAWLLVDEDAIRQVSGNPKGRMPLGLPSPRVLESLARPKERLEAVLSLASGQTGRRLQRNRERFGSQRAQLLAGLDLHGTVTLLPAWQTLVRDITTTVAGLRERENHRRSRISAQRF